MAWKIKLVDVLPKCDFCGKDALYDAPIETRQWAYTCKECALVHDVLRQSAVGCQFKLRVKEAGKKSLKILKGKITNLDDVYSGDDPIYACPSCGEERTMEVDADCVYECEGCGSKIRVRALI